MESWIKKLTRIEIEFNKFLYSQISVLSKLVSFIDTNP